MKSAEAIRHMRFTLPNQSRGCLRHCLLKRLLSKLIRAFAAVITFASLPASGQFAKPPIRGLVSMGSLAFNGNPGALPTDSMKEINAHPSIYSAAVISLLWSQLEPQEGVFDDSALTSALASIASYNATYPATPVAAKLRIFAGAGTPAWVMQLTGGPITITSSNGSIQIAAFWTSAYRTAWEALQAHLASGYDASSTIAEVAISSCSSLTAEPFIAPLDAASLANMRQFGFNDATYMACLDGAMGDYSAWVNTPLDFTFNSYRNSDSCTTTDDTSCLVENPAFTIQVMQAFRGDLGMARSVVANHGLQDPLTAAALPIYSEFQTLYLQAQAQSPPVPSPLEFQSYGPAVDWDSTIQYGLTYHPTEIEIWDTVAAGGPASISTTQLETYAGELQTAKSPSSPALISAASLQVGAVAPASLISIFGGNLSNASGSSTVTITDSSGSQQQASIVYTSPSQINAVLPAGLANGTAIFDVLPAGGSSIAASFPIVPVAPGIFSINASGTGVAAAETITQHLDGTITNGQVFTCPATGACTPAPIDVAAPGDTVYLILFGTGFRNRSSLGNTSVTFGTQTVAPLYAGAQNQFAGLDQVNVIVPPSLAGAGPVNIALTADQLPSNVVTIQIQ